MTMKDSNSKDTALRQAIAGEQEETRIKLPSNFAFTTMRRIEAERRHSARRQRIAATVALAMACAAGIGTVVWLCADSFITMLQHHMDERQAALSTAVTTTVCLTFFSVLNAILRKIFFNEE